MMRSLYAFAILLALWLVPASAAAQGETTALFQSDEALTVRIDGPVKQIARLAERSTDPQPAVLTANGETHRIALSARGVSRRKPDKCRFPPMRVEFAEKPGPASLFSKQRSLKLVSHCQANDRFEQFAAREFVTYRLYNLLTEQSLKVRPLNVQYFDNGTLLTERFGFFIEDIDNTARRLGGKELDVPSVPHTAIDQQVAARYSLFQYMIGNTDWDMIVGPPGTDCCHNSKVIGLTKDAQEALVPIPYDFDNTGIVDTPYSVAAVALPIRSVRQRYYRGFCAHNPQVPQVVGEFLRQRAALIAEINGQPYLDDRSKKSMTDYLSEFFQLIEDPGAIEKKILKTCR